MSGTRGHEIIPSAKRLIHSLRDLGYEFAPAVADLVDNSIEAGASQIEITVTFQGDESWVRIADNGCGMTSNAMLEAMRYGSTRDYAENDLGRFGLGLKTASMSQCERLTVASRARSNGRFAVFSWDLAHVTAADKWEVLELSIREQPAPVAQATNAGYKTVIFWERLDRMLGFKHPYGEPARRQLAQMTRDLEDHLAMVFHRFLAGEAKQRRVQIKLNGHPIKPWDPFCRSERLTRKLEARSLPIEHNNIEGEVLVEPFVLPHQTRFSSPGANEKASGPKKWNRQQGFYIYRADRLIQSGGWSGLRTLDEHTKLARVALSFSPKLDHAFKINVAKMSVQLPAQIRSALDHFLAPTIRAANTEYRNSGSQTRASRNPQPTVSTASFHGVSAGNTVSVQGNSPRASAPVVLRYTPDEILARLLTIATEAEQAVLRSVFSRLESEPPSES